MKGVSSQTKNGATYWYARINGQSRYMGKGEDARKRAEAARSKWNVTKYERRDELAGLKVKKTEFKTVIDLSNWYMALPTVQEKKAYHRYVFCCARLLEYFGKKPVTALDGDDFEHYRTQRKARGASDATVNLELTVLRAMYYLARKRKKIPPEAMPGDFAVSTGNGSAPRRAITDEEFKALCHEADEDFRDVLVVAYETAMRSSELCDLRVHQVHAGVTHIRGGKLNYISLGIFDTKNKTERIVPLSEEVLEVLKRRMVRLEDDNLILTRNGNRWTKRAIVEQFKRCCRKAGLVYGDKATNAKGERVGLVFHCLRHTRTSRWVEAGFSDEIVRKATGHKSLEAYRKYVHLDPAVVMRLVEGNRSADLPENRKKIGARP